MLTTTFRLLRKHGACAPQYTILRKHLQALGRGEYQLVELETRGLGGTAAGAAWRPCSRP